MQDTRRMIQDTGFHAPSSEQIDLLDAATVKGLEDQEASIKGNSDFARLTVKSLRGAKRRGNLLHREIASLSLAMTGNCYVFRTNLRNLVSIIPDPFDGCSQVSQLLLNRFISPIDMVNP
jgi:hypothetical protein